MNELTIRPAPVVVDEPTSEPVTLAEAKLQCAIGASDTADDSLLVVMIKAARMQAEHITGSAFVTRTLELRLDGFSVDGVCLEIGPVREIISVKYYDTSGLEQTLAPVRYVLDAAAVPGYVLPAYGTEWPDTLDTPNAVRIRYRSGWGDDATMVPEDVRLWILSTVATMYRNREAFAQGISVADLPGRFVDRLLDPYTRVTM